MVSYAISTYRKSKEFNEKLKKLQKTIKPITIRTYLLAENMQKSEQIKEKLGLNDEQIAQINELKELRISGIKAEMQYALAQARANGVELSEEIISGRSLTIGFNKELLNKVPSLGVYELFILFTEEEIDEYIKTGR